MVNFYNVVFTETVMRRLFLSPITWILSTLMEVYKMTPQNLAQSGLQGAQCRIKVEGSSPRGMTLPSAWAVGSARGIGLFSLSRVQSVPRGCELCGRWSPRGLLGNGWERTAWGFFFIWESAYFLIGLGINEWLRSVWSEQSWVLERVI